MNKKELVAAVSDDADITRDQASNAIDAVFAHIENSVSKGDEVRISGFGTFKAQYRPARTARNPQTGAEIKIKETAVAKFAPAKDFKEAAAKAKARVKKK